MRVLLLMQELGRAGGQQVVLGYARALRERRGWDVELVMVDPRTPPEARDVDGIPTVTLAHAAAGPEADCVLATWWATAGSLWEVPARRRAVFLQSIESRFYDERHFHERFAAEQVLVLPVGYVAVAQWLCDVIAELRPDARCAVVRNGVDKDVFAPRVAPPPDGPLRVLVEGQPSMWIKGVHEAVAAVRSMREPHELTVVAPDPSASDGLDGVRVVGALGPEEMAATYAEHDVVLKLSRVEGLGLVPIEAFHVGVPAVVAPYTGHEEYLRHGRNGLVVGYDDLPGTTRALDTLARDRDLLRRLGEGALATARAWPSPDSAADDFAAALEQLVDAPEPDTAAALRHHQRAQRRWLELTRDVARRAEETGGSLAWYVHHYEDAQNHIDELNAALKEAQDEVARSHHELAAVRESRAYRAAVAARRIVRRDG